MRSDPQGPARRLVIHSIGPDPRAESVRAGAKSLLLPDLGGVRVAQIIWCSVPLADDDRCRLSNFLVDPLLQTGQWGWDEPLGQSVEVAYLPGVTDSEAREVQRAASILGIEVGEVATGRLYEFEGPVAPVALDSLVRRLLANAVVERWSVSGPVLPPLGTLGATAPTVERFRLGDQASLATLNLDRAMALDPEELLAVRDYFTLEGRDPSDVELEMIAQTWSEHCAHKTFRARLVDENGVEFRPLLQRIRDTTDQIGSPHVVSAFVGNAGIVTYDGVTTLALKCETHNHPSAVEPFGGANTGVGGVIRDILGAAHDPIVCTDILCFGPLDLAPALLPTGSLHPRRIHDGVISGVADYGNKIGLPTIAGAVLYDEGYVANPLVFAGCIGRSTLDAPVLSGPHTGDSVIVMGGRTGRDGIRGATFSSLAMDATTGEVAGASVQIGDPLTERLVMEALRECVGMYSAITDCGAGGLSSAVGEMAEGIGATCELDRVPLKYHGLAPWEVWLSESQERMVLAARDPEPIRRVCERFGIDVAVIGTFTGSGRIVVTSGDAVVCDLDTSFLHDGRPQRTMVFRRPLPSQGGPGEVPVPVPLAETLLLLLAHPNICSRSSVVHRYDHEIGGATVVRPLTGHRNEGHSDGTVWIDPRADEGFAIGIGVNPWYGIADPMEMGRLVVDEAIRNAVASGADPSRVTLLDNFSWGDPRDPEVLGQLWATVEGMCEASSAFGAPFVSGKDSLNNAWTGTDGVRTSIPPTLVVTAVAAVHADHVVTSDLKEYGNALVLLGRTESAFGGSHLNLVLGMAGGAVPRADESAPARYRRLHEAMSTGLVRSCHDCSEGGLAVTLAEMCIAGGFGAHIDVLPADDAITAWFSESSGRLVVEVRRGDLERFLDLMGMDALVIGEVTADPVLRMAGDVPVPLVHLAAAWSGGTS